jgi:hypothetical protein
MESPMFRTATRSTRFLTGLSTVLLVVSVGFGAFVLIGAAFGFGPSGHDLGIHTKVATTRVADLPPDAITPDRVDVIVRVHHATTAQIRWLAARDLVPGALVIIGLWLIRGLLASVRDGDPFTQRNVARLRTLAVVVLVGTPLATLVSSLFADRLASSAGLDGPGARLSMPSAVLLGGLALLVLAEVFAAGVRLRDDLEGTV